MTANGISSPPHRGGLVRIRADQLIANFRAVDAAFGPRLIAVVKGDGYGHGLVTSAGCFARAGATTIAVATRQEALRLRAAGITTRILILDSGEPPTGHVADTTLEWVVGQAGVARLLTAPVRSCDRFRVHLEIDVGLGRGGVPAADAASVLGALIRRPWIELTGICAHLPSAPSHELVAAALRDLRRLRSLAPRSTALHLGGSDALPHAAGLEDVEVRVGRLLYGVRPRWLKPGQLAGVGLGWAWTANAEPYELPPRLGYGHRVPARAASNPVRLDIGYADGLPPAAAGSWPLIAGGSGHVIEEVFMLSSIAYPVDGGLPIGCSVGALLCGRDGNRQVPVRTVSQALGMPTSSIFLLPRSPRMLGPQLGRE